MTHAIITPIFGEPTTAHKAEEWAKVPVIAGGISPHDRSRGYLAARALKETDADLFLWLDADIAITPEQADQLIASASETDADLMAGCYPCRHAARSGQIALSFNASGSGRMELVFGTGGSIIPIHACGFGCVVTHRRIFTPPIAPECDYTDHEGRTYPGRAWFLPLVRGRDHLGEDRSFCVRLLEFATLKFRMYVDTRVSVDHTGYTIEGLLEGQSNG